MKFEQLKYLCELLSSLQNLSFGIYEKGNLLSFTSEFLNQYDDDLLKAQYSRYADLLLFADSKKPIDVLSDGHLLFGFVKDMNSDLSITIGPVSCTQLLPEEIEEVLSRHNIPKDIIEDSFNFIANSCVMEYSAFLKCLSFIFFAINHEKYEFTTLFNSEVTNNHHESGVSFSSQFGHSSGEYEEKMYFYIKNGMVDEINKLIKSENFASVSQPGSDYIRSLKNSLIIMNTLSLRAAVSGGLDRETAYTVGELYSQRIENAQTLNELITLSSIIRKDYCKRVNEIKEREIENPLIYKANKYILSHIYSKITASDIAKEIGISKEYLSVKFKEAMGMSIPQYINKVKIKEAKKLLCFTNQSLAEIAKSLNYSSQSHFQNEFKKLSGRTPVEYKSERKGL